MQLQIALALFSVVAAAQAVGSDGGRLVEASGVAPEELISPHSSGFIDGHIVGGQLAKPGQFPYQVALLDANKKLFCGGAILDPQWIITAAHCAVSQYRFLVVAGAFNFSAEERSQQRIWTTKKFVHEDFNNEALENDIALIKLPTKLEFNEFVQPVRLPSERAGSFWNSQALISGWGFTSDYDSHTPAELRYVEARVVSNFYCRFRYFFLAVGENNICTSGWFRKGHCNGDSGGPTVVKDVDGEYTLVGINSFSIKIGCQYSWPSASTRVSKFTHWVNHKRLYA